MTIYILTFMISLFLYYSFTSNKLNNSSRNIFKNTNSRLVIYKLEIATALSSIPPMFLASVRYKVGTDYGKTYYTGFYRILENNNFDDFEFGYFYLNKIIQIFTENVFILFILTSILFVGITFAAIYELSVNIPLSIILLLVTRYYFIGLNVVRQFIAMAICTYAIKFIVEKKEIKFILAIFIAMSLHYSAILFLPSYFIGKIVISKRKLICLAIFDISFFSFGTKFILQIIQKTKYGLKYNFLNSAYGVCGTKFTLFTIFLNLFILIIAYNQYKEQFKNPQYRIFLNIQIVAFLISLVLQSLPFVERIYWIYSFPSIISIPHFFKGFKAKKIKQLTLVLLIFVFIAYMIYDILILGDHDVVPYNSIFGKTPIHYSGWEF